MVRARVALMFGGLSFSGSLYTYVGWGVPYIPVDDGQRHK